MPVDMAQPLNIQLPMDTLLMGEAFSHCLQPLVILLQLLEVLLPSYYSILKRKKKIALSIAPGKKEMG